MILYFTEFTTFSLQNITDLDAGLDGKNLDRGQYRFQPIKFMNFGSSQSLRDSYI